MDQRQNCYQSLQRGSMVVPPSQWPYGSFLATLLDTRQKDFSLLFKLESLALRFFVYFLQMKHVNVSVYTPWACLARLTIVCKRLAKILPFFNTDFCCSLSPEGIYVFVVFQIAIAYRSSNSKQPSTTVIQELNLQLPCDNFEHEQDNCVKVKMRILRVLSHSRSFRSLFSDSVGVFWAKTSNRF